MTIKHTITNKGVLFQTYSLIIKLLIKDSAWIAAKSTPEQAINRYVTSPMAIIYAVVARATVVLAEFSAVTGNTGAVVRRILEKLSPETADERLCFSQDGYIFHILRSDGLTFLCMANDTFGSKPHFLNCHGDFESL